MSSLFVAEEPEQPEVHLKLEPGVEADIDDIEIKKEVVNGAGEEEESKQSGDVEMKYYDDEESDSEEEDLDDPIVDTIPVHLNATIKDDSLAPLLLQFPNKSRHSQLAQNHISALHKLQIKPKSGVVELRLPLDTSHFFSETASEKYNVSEQVLRGVIIHDEPIGKLSEGTIPSISVVQQEGGVEVSGSNGARKVKEEKKSLSNNPTLNSLTSIRTQPGAVGGSRYLVGVQDKEGRLHVTPLSDTCMLRPHFSYIDQSKMSKLERERELQRELNGEGSGNGNNNGNGKDSGNGGGEGDKKAKNVSVVTMSAKSTKENIPRLGGALLSAKMEAEEEGEELAIVPCDEEFIAKHFVEKTSNVLKSKFTQREYMDLLFEQTKL